MRDVIYNVSYHVSAARRLTHDNWGISVLPLPQFRLNEQ